MKKGVQHEKKKKIKAMALLLCMKDCLVMMIMLERVTV